MAGYKAMSYSFTSRIRFSETGGDKKLTLEGILNYFQDCATFHSEDVGLGVETFAGMDRVWVLSSWQICVDRYPDVCENVVITTWPYDFKGFMGLRNFTMKTVQGELLAWANSVWSYLAPSAGRPVKVPEEICRAYHPEPGLDMVYASRKVPLPKQGVPMEPIQVRREHLDCNGHVNNGKYIQLAADFLPEDFKVAQMRAEYRKQARQGELLYPMVEQRQGSCVVAFCDSAGNPYEVTAFDENRGKINGA